MKSFVTLLFFSLLLTSCIVIKVYEAPKTAEASPKLIKQKKRMLSSDLIVPFPEEGTEIMFFGSDEPPLPIPIENGDSLAPNTPSKAMVFRVDTDQQSPMHWIAKDSTFGKGQQLLIKIKDKEGDFLAQVVGQGNDSLCMMPPRIMVPPSSSVKTDDAGTGEKDKKNVFVFVADDDTSIQPLIIIDGEEKPRGYDLEGINPDQIERIDVLKGAVAKKRVGEKGVHGVIVIKTKKN